MHRLAALLLVMAWGCGPNIIWHGYDPSRTDRIVLEERKGRQQLLINDAPGPAFDGIAYTTLTFGDDGRLAYAAAEQDQWFVVVDQAPQPQRWAGISEIVLSPDGSGLAYTAVSGEGWRVVRDGEPDAPVDAVFVGTLSFDATGAHLLYAAQEGRCVFVVFDGGRGPCFEVLADLGFAPAAETPTWGYLAQRDRAVLAVVNGRVIGRWDEARNLVFSPDEWPLIAYQARRGPQSVVVVDGAPGLVWDDVHSLTVAVGRHVAYVGQSDDGEHVVRGDLVSPPYEAVERGSLVYSPRGGSLAYVAREAERVFVVRDGVRGPSFREITPIVFDATGTHHAYSAVRRDGSWALVVDDERVPSPHLTWAGAPVFSQTGEGLAVIVHDGETMGVLHRRVHDGPWRLHRFDLVIEGTLAFGAGADDWGAVVADAKGREISVALRGEESVPFSVEELVARLAQRPMEPGDADLRAMLVRHVQAELARHQR